MRRDERRIPSAIKTFADKESRKRLKVLKRSLDQLHNLSIYIGRFCSLPL